MIRLSAYRTLYDIMASAAGFLGALAVFSFWVSTPPHAASLAGAAGLLACGCFAIRRAKFDA